jgi:hypothetical protein
MIHVLTVHHKSSQWVDVQVAYLRRHMHEPYRVVANLEDVPGDPAHRFDRVIEAEGPHAESSISWQPRSAPPPTRTTS